MEERKDEREVFETLKGKKILMELRNGSDPIYDGKDRRQEEEEKNKEKKEERIRMKQKGKKKMMMDIEKDEEETKKD